MNKSGLKTHGMTHTPIYRVWLGMRQRCSNSNSPAYKHYGARGIKVCKRWSRFENFYQDMGNVPSPEMELDRIDGNKGYYKDNCRWATRTQQLINRRSWKQTGLPKYVVKVVHKYKSYVKRKGFNHYIGCFKTPEEAHKAAVKKAKELDND